ncbi:MAG: hypothetical protein ACD_69C00347G0001 [uncultured bacterium]|nr:MAG: hypothetical protein ACD_69C00347G0001 [uncultured bacterium]
MEQQSSDKVLIKNILEIASESQTLEFKRLSGDNVVSKLIETIVAMANTYGGSIILGVDDPEKTKLKGMERIFGIDENADIFDALGREIPKIIPPLSGIWPPIVIKADNNKRIALLSIPKAEDNFRSSNNCVYVRAEKSNRRLNAHEIVEFAYAKGFTKADTESVEIDFSLLNTPFFQEWKQARNISGDRIETILEKTGLARKNKGGELLPTLAALLLFAEFPSDLTETKCAIRILQYTGKIEQINETPNLIGIPKTLQGSLVKLISDTHSYVLNTLRSGIKIPSGFQNVYQIPERAVKEAITNAVVHRDYHMKRDIEIRIFEDRLEVDSPGLFPYNITPKNIGIDRAHGYRNDTLVKHLREFPSPPNLDQNEGVRAMRSEMKAKGLYPPKFFTYPDPCCQDFVRVVLFNERSSSEWEKINDYLTKEKYIANEQARQITAISDKDRMSKMLKKWVNQGLLVQIIPSSGAKKAVKYKLADKSEIVGKNA